MTLKNNLMQDNIISKTVQRYSSFNQLTHLFVGYFHQDFAVEFGDTERALSVYIDNASTIELRATADVLSALIRDVAGLSNEDVGKILVLLGCEYHTPAGGFTNTTWLEHLERRLRQALAQRGATN